MIETSSKRFLKLLTWIPTSLVASDRFGSYGVIGFSIVDRREPRMTDLMFSCRVQSKRVEHAFLAYLLGKYISGIPQRLPRELSGNASKCAVRPCLQ